MKLYELSGRYAALYDAAVDVNGDVPDELFEALEGAEEALEEKVAACVRVVRNLEADREALKAEADRFAKRAKVAANAADRLKDYVLRCLQAAGVAKVDGLIPVAVRQSNPAVAIADESAIPAQFARLERVIDRAAVLAALKRGEAVPGASLTRGTHLRIG